MISNYSFQYLPNECSTFYIKSPTILYIAPGLTADILKSFHDFSIRTPTRTPAKSENSEYTDLLHWACIKTFEPLQIEKILPWHFFREEIFPHYDLVNMIYHVCLCIRHDSFCIQWVTVCLHYTTKNIYIMCVHV